MASRTRSARSKSACRRARSVLRVGPRLPRKVLAWLGVLGPDGPVAGVVGGVRAAGRVAHPGQWPVGVRGAGEFQAERAGRVGEPAVVRGAEVQRLGALGEQVEHFTVAALGLRRRSAGERELAVDVGEELGEFAGTWSGGHDALLVVAELGPDQLQVAVGLVLVDLGQQLGLSAAWPGGVAFGCGHRDVLEVQFRGEYPAGPVGELDRQRAAQRPEADGGPRGWGRVRVAGRPGR